jgi:hypothetical protein
MNDHQLGGELVVVHQTTIPDGTIENLDFRTIHEYGLQHRSPPARPGFLMFIEL